MTVGVGGDPSDPETQETFTHDHMNRVTRWSRPSVGGTGGWQVDYDLDVLGNPRGRTTTGGATPQDAKQNHIGHTKVGTGGSGVSARISGATDRVTANF